MCYPRFIQIVTFRIYCKPARCELTNSIEVPKRLKHMAIAPLVFTEDGPPLVDTLSSSQTVNQTSH